MIYKRNNTFAHVKSGVRAGDDGTARIQMSPKIKVIRKGCPIHTPSFITKKLLVVQVKKDLEIGEKKYKQHASASSPTG